MIPVTRINHAVLYVRDAEVAANFYMAAFDFEPVGPVTNRVAFLRRVTATITTTSACSGSVPVPLLSPTAASASTTSRGRCRRSKRWPRPARC